MKTKKDLLVPTVVSDPSKEEDGLYTPDELKWEVRDLIAGFASHFDMLGKPIIDEPGRSFLIAKEKPSWVVDPLSTLSAATTKTQKDKNSFGYLAEVPSDQWAHVIKTHSRMDSIGDIEISIDIPRERVLTVFPDKTKWINAMHRNFFEAIKERFDYFNEVGMSIHDLHGVFFPFAKSVSFYLYPDSAVA